MIGNMPHRYSKVKETIVSTKVDDDDLDSALEDYKAASTLMRFNRSCMKSCNVEPY